MALLYPEEIDQRLNWPLGRAERLARQRRLPYVLLVPNLRQAGIDVEFGTAGRGNRRRNIMTLSRK